MAIKICLDAGHYGKYNRSPAVSTYYESEMNWKLHLLLKKHLEQYGIQVITTRTDQAKNMGTKSRGKAAKGCDLFLSIHSNAVGITVDEVTDYPLVIVPIDGSGDVLGDKLAKCIETTMGTKQTGRIYEKKTSGGKDWYGVINGAASVGVPGLILEHSFHTCTRIAKWLQDDSNLEKMAAAEAKIIAEHFGLAKPANEKTVSIDLPVLKKDAKGETVKAMQNLLIGYGYQMVSNAGKVYGADGSFGGATERALMAYQEEHGLSPDGSCGPKTWRKLLGV